MPKTLTSIRMSDETQRKIDELLAWWGAGSTKSEVMIVAIDRLYQQEKENKTMASRQSQINRIAWGMRNLMDIDPTGSMDYAEFERMNRATGWTIDGPNVGADNWIRTEGIVLTDGELRQAYEMAEQFDAEN